MSKFKPRLARYNNCCEQVMPAPVIPICAVSCQLPRPICEVNWAPLYCNQLPPTYQASQSSASSCAPCQQQQQPINNNHQPPPNNDCSSCNLTEQTVPEPPQSSYNITIDNYVPGNTYSLGTILTNMTGLLPEGFLLCNGAEVSRTDYVGLFNLMGIIFGDGDGSTTFNIPNLGDSSVNEATYIIKT